MLMEPPAPILIEEIPTPPVYEIRTSSLGRPPWDHLKALRVAGSRREVEIRAGLYWDEGDGLGTYYSSTGLSHLCNRDAAWQMAYEEDVDFTHEFAGRHTGGVWSVNYKYDPAYLDREIGAGRS